MKHILDTQKDNVSVLSLINWLSKIFEEEIAKISNNKIVNQKASRYILLALSLEDGVTQSDLVRTTHLKGSTISLSLEKMEKEGYISRENDSYDSRMSRVFITKKGYELKLFLDDIMKKIEEKALKDIMPKDSELTKFVVLSIIKNLHSEF